MEATKQNWDRSVKHQLFSVAQIGTRHDLTRD